MSTTKKASKKANKTVAVTIKRGRGRPASFPGTITKGFLTTIPVEAIAQLHELQVKWGVNLNQAVTRMIERSHKDAFRNRKAAVNS